MVRKHNRFKDIFFFIGLSLSLVYMFCWETYWQLPGFGLKILRWGSYFFLIIHLTTISIRRFSIHDLLWFFSFLILSTIVGINIKQDYRCIITALLVFGAKGVSFTNITKTYFIVGFVFCVATIISSFMGLIPSREVDVDIFSRISFFSTGKRMCWGYKWCSDIASHITYILLSYWLLKKGLLNKIELCLLATISVTVLYYTDTKLTFFVSCILLGLSFTCKYYKRKNIFPTHKFTNLLTIIVLGIPVFAYLVVTFYNPLDIFWDITNIIFTGRLSLCSDALQNVGITPLGQYYEMIGAGNDEATNYIDISYLQLAIIYGYVYTLCVLTYFYLCTKRAISKRSLSVLLGIIVVMIDGLVAQHVSWVEFNPLLLYFFSQDNYNLAYIYKLPKVLY